MKVNIIRLFEHCGKLNNVPQRYPGLKSLEQVNFTLYGKRDFADVIKVQNLRWGDYLGLSG